MGVEGKGKGIGGKGRARQGMEGKGKKGREGQGRQEKLITTIRKAKIRETYYDVREEKRI